MSPKMPLMEPASRSDDAFVLDDSAAPIVRVTYPEHVTTGGYERLFDDYVALCARHPRIAWLVDMRDFNPLMVSAPVRKTAAEVFERARAPLLRSTVCEARVVSSTAMRGVLMAFDWVTGSKWPVKNVDSVGAAEVWIARQLRG